MLSKLEVKSKFYLCCFLLVFPLEAYNSTYQSESVQNTRACADRSLHTILSGNSIDECDRRCVNNEKCILFDFDGGICRHWWECHPITADTESSYFVSGEMCEKQDSDVLGSMNIYLFKTSYFEQDTLNLFFQLPRDYIFNTAEFGQGSATSASYRLTDSTMYWSHYDYNCVTIFKGAFPLWLVYDESTGLNDLGLTKESGGMLKGELTVVVNEEVEFNGGTTMREIGMVMPFSIAAKTEITLEASGTFQGSDDSENSLRFESAKQMPHLVEAGKLSSEFRVIGKSTLDGKLLEIAPEVLSNSDQYETSQQTLRILEACEDCPYEQTWELSFDANYVCRSGASYTASLPMLESSGERRDQVLEFDLTQSSACGQIAACTSGICPYITVDGSESGGLKSFYVGEEVHFSLHFAGETPGSALITDMYFYVRNGDQPVFVGHPIGVGSENRWENIVDVDESAEELTWSVFLDPSLEWFDGIQSVEMKITVMIFQRRRWLGIFEPILRRFLSSSLEMETPFSVSTDVCTTSRPQGEVIIPPGEIRRITCEDEAMSQWLICHANLTITEWPCDYTVKIENTDGESSEDKILGLSAFTWVIILTAVLLPCALCILLGYCYYFRSGDAKGERIVSKSPVFLTLSATPPDAKSSTKKENYDFDATSQDDMSPFKRITKDATPFSSV